MDPIRRQLLLERREALQKRLRRASSRADLGRLPKILEAAGTPYQLYYPDDPHSPDWQHDLVHFSVFHLDWSTVTLSLDVVLGVEWYREIVPLVTNAVVARAAPEEGILLVSSRGTCPIVEVTRSAFEQHAEALLDLDPFEMWISGRDKPWLIELRSPFVRAVG